jgi:hypothetical protein
LREEHRPKVLENRVLRIFVPKEKKLREVGEDHIMTSCITCTPYHTLLQRSNQGGEWTGHVARLGAREIKYFGWKN